MAHLPLNNNPVFELGMEAMTKDTPGSYEEFNSRYIQMLENLLYLERNKQDAINEGYDGRDLEMTFAQLKEKVKTGDFSGLHLYDYIDFTTTYGEKVRAEIMGFNTMFNVGSMAIRRPHILLQTRDCLFDTRRYNSTATNSGGFDSSELKTNMDTILSTFPEELRRSITQCGRYESIKGSQLWFTRKLFLPTETEVFGYPCKSEKKYCAAGMQWEGYQKSYKRIVKGEGFGKAQDGTVSSWWLSSPVEENQSELCCVTGEGNISVAPANSVRGIAPAFIIG